MKTDVSPNSIEHLDFHHEPVCQVRFADHFVPRERCGRPAKWFAKFVCCGQGGYICDSCKEEYVRSRPSCMGCGVRALLRLIRL